MSRTVLLLFLLVAAAPGATLEAEFFRWLAFGDSITLGNYDFANEGGYPGRLHELLNCSPGVCEVFNAGKSGEKTYQGISRIDSVLEDDGPFDVMMLMEGTNDIFVEYSVENAVWNLRIMALKAQGEGTDTVHASIIWYHPDGDYGTTKDDEVEALRDGVEDAAITYSRYFVDIWDVLCPDSHPDVHGHTQTQCFNQHYSDVPNGDDRGHPIGSGYTMMANAFLNGLISVPIPDASSPVAPTGTINEARPAFHWDRESPVRANWYRVEIEGDSGPVIDRWLKASTYCDTSTCSFTPASFEELVDGDYTWQVQGRNPAGLAPWSADMSFTVFLNEIFSDGFESGDTGAWFTP